MADIRVMRDVLLPPSPSERRHLLSIADLSRDDVQRLLATARSFARSLEREMKKLPTLRGRTVVNMFYESSTRTTVRPSSGKSSLVARTSGWACRGGSPPRT